MEKAGADLITIEMSDDDYGFQIEDSIKLTGDCFLEQKENLIVKGMDLIEDDVFAWIDCDIVFEDNDWMSKTLDSLSSNDIVQMFETVILLNPDGGEDRRFKSMLSEFYNNPLFNNGHPNQGHPGFAFAGRKEKVKFYNNFVFSNDVVFCSSLTHDYWIIKSWDISDEMKSDIIKWCESNQKTKFSFVDLNAKHLWHGSWTNRMYNSRMKIVDKHRHKVKIKNGLYSCEDGEAKKDFIELFRKRKEDVTMFI